MSDDARQDPVECAAASAREPDNGAGDSVAANDKRFKVVAIVAAVLLAPQVIAHVLIPVLVVPTFKTMFDSMGGTLPPPTAILVGMGAWLAPLLVLIDVAVFWGCYRLARKYWIGLLFAPLFAQGLFLVPLIWALYTPMFEITTLVK
jgi:hypothetical protein